MGCTIQHNLSIPIDGGIDVSDLGVTSSIIRLEAPMFLKVSRVTLSRVCGQMKIPLSPERRVLCR